MNSSPGGAAAIRSGAQRKRGRFGEEEQGSQRSFRRQAEAELSGLCDGEDGGLIGGASLKPADFVEIINSANQE